jgi:predicted nuclease of restriction endonuclease-like RecB superfamily
VKSFRNFGTPKKSKYKNKKTEIDGIVFDSKAEGECYRILMLMHRNRQIKFIERQPKVYMTLARILYIPDFVIEEAGERIYIDVKGHRTKDFNLKARLWEYYGQGVLRLIRLSDFGFEKIKEIRTHTQTSER